MKAAPVTKGVKAADKPPAVAPPSVHEVLASPGQPLDAPTRAFMEPRFGRYFPGPPPAGSGGYAPLAVNQPGDAFEREAESVAGRVMALAPAAAGPSHDFARVRVHTGSAAAASAENVRARAYTVGSEIVFGAGQYAPGTDAGRTLLAHELAHVVQQGRAGTPRLARFEAPIHEGAERHALTTPSDPPGPGTLTNEEASAVYFGNWMRDVNQAFVPILTDLMPPDTVFALVSYMAATKFGREMTPEQFGYYIPAEHIDNPAGLVPADLLPAPPTVTATAPPVPNRLGPARPADAVTPQADVDPTHASVQGVNPFAADQSGVMAYIRNTNLHVESRLRLAATAGRTPDGMLHFGAALHAIEDLFAHSNYVEIAVDKLLRQDRTFLPGPAGQPRRVFTYAPEVTLAGGARRPVLTTGTFTTPDTKVSIASELYGVLSRPLGPPANNAEQRAQERFIYSVLRSYDARMRSSPELRRAISDALQQAHVPPSVADQADRVPVATIYKTATDLAVHLPDWVLRDLQVAVRTAMSRYVLQPIAEQFEATALDAVIAETNLIAVLRDSLRQGAGRYTPAEQAVMNVTTRFTSKPRAQQEAEAAAAGTRRAQAIRATPVAVVAGPSHSQIAKDHANSPFFGIAFQLATVADRRLRDLMLAAWNAGRGAPTAPYNFEWANFPQAAPAGTPATDATVYEESRHLYHDSRGGPTGRAARDQQSLQRGASIVAQGGEPGQSFDLTAMRREAAAQIRAVAGGLQALAGAPGATAGALDQFRALAGRSTSQMAERFRRHLTQASGTASAAAGAQAFVTLATVAADLLLVATAVENARDHAARDRANATLRARRSEMLLAFAQQPSLNSGLAAAMLHVLDQEIQATAVAYSTDQRNVLEGRASVPEMGTAARGPAVTILILPPLTGTPAVAALLTEARMLLSHPYDNLWWEPTVRAYATRFADHLRNDIEARNEGVPFYRDAAGGHGHGP